MENVEVAKVLEEIAALLDLQGENPFRIRAYRNAGETLRSLAERVEDMVEAGKPLSKLAGIGKSTSTKIVQILETGTCERLQELREITPSGLIEMTAIPGLGPKKVMAIYETLGISTVDGLKAAAEAGELAGKVPGLGSKSEGAILAAIETLPEDTARIPLRHAMRHVRAIGAYLSQLDSVVRYEVAGSFRRGRETVHDLDFLLEAPDHIAARDAVLAYDDVRQEIAAGTEKASVRLHDGLQVDFRFVDPTCFGSALMYFTGSKSHNIELRKRAIDQGRKLSEYGLFEGESVIASETEAEVYEALDLPWIPPEIREDRGELILAEDGALPTLLQRGHLCGDMFVCGKDLRVMAESLAARGDAFVVIGAASRSEAAVRAHLEAARALDAELGIRVLVGVDVDIDEAGDLELPDDLLEECDWVVASVRTALTLNEAAMTDRLLGAIGCGLVDALARPLGRSADLGLRIAVDIDRVWRACVDHGVCLEIDSHPHLLEAPAIFYRAAVEAGVRVVMASRASSAAELWALDLAVATARRGWVMPQHVSQPFI